MKKFFAAAAVISAFAVTPAFADCAGDVAKIDETLKTVKLDEATDGKVKSIMEKVKMAQDAKDEAACTTSTTEVMTLLGIKAG